MNSLKIFRSNEFGELSVIVKDNKEYIEGIQVAMILGYSNPRDAIIRHCTNEGVIFSDVGVVTGKRSDNSDIVQYVNKKFIDEGNMYRLIMRSKLQSAKRFERWVVDEVIPSIRNHGTYMNDDVISKTLEDPDFIIRLATKLKKEKEEKVLALEKAEKLEEVIAIDKPYTDFGKGIAASKDAITIGQFAKILNNDDKKTGRNRLFKWLRENGYLIAGGKEKNMPKQAYINQGLFKVDEKLVMTMDGEVISTTTLITGKGQLYFIDKFDF
ncbi:phage repressor protein/antirepressor Ant [Romboutsia ilealis]|uniref:Phage antirepressor KilAC domain-containing protein n=1 Tax=Romboutsia faecis TaxID=2764597 RepID=A0ABR7JNM6_9FIRM|nr:phage antirepressor KilAC domain-containing protein [Romboutsia faecis]MBC5996509.1 phage antirepressor KilAC domain-containing protein [Romboutsia faecis]MRN24035.1 phage repressor protein/antirepressor Ant [Romboutsia ilealis]